jgi:c-di-GMP-binding flagellar brake protein YcgR
MYLAGVAMVISRGEERRRAARIPVLVQAACETPQSTIFGNCENLSETGMLIAARQTFDTAQRVILRFALPTVLAGKVIQTGGIVVRVQEGEYMAVDFSDMRPPFREAVARFVKESMGAGNLPRSS